MLYDPKWTKPAADVFSLEGLIKWLEKQPGEKEYNFWDCQGQCLYGQYMLANGFTWAQSENQPFGSAIDTFETLVYDYAWQKPFTFGAALSRARTASHGRG